MYCIFNSSLHFKLNLQLLENKKMFLQTNATTFKEYFYFKSSASQHITCISLTTEIFSVTDIALRAYDNFKGIPWLLPKCRTFKNLRTFFKTFNSIEIGILLHFGCIANIYLHAQFFCKRICKSYLSQTLFIRLLRFYLGTNSATLNILSVVWFCYDYNETFLKL